MSGGMGDTRFASSRVTRLGSKEGSGTRKDVVFGYEDKCDHD